MKTAEQWAAEMDADRRHMLDLLYNAAERLLAKGDDDGAKAIEDGLKAMPSMKVVDIQRGSSR